mmetsp:Transcript_44374/g.142158  ORF Transcript_44374/g.142158 Transcript_44374/m.142158 type:complete len:425 (+) Transcript_44374:129-1403(+)
MLMRARDARIPGSQVHNNLCGADEGDERTPGPSRRARQKVTSSSLGGRARRASILRRVPRRILAPARREHVQLDHLEGLRGLQHCILLLEPRMPVLTHPLLLSEQRLLRRACAALFLRGLPCRRLQPKHARRPRGEGEGADLHREPLGVVPLVESPTGHDIGAVGGPGAVAEVRGRRELGLLALRSHGLDVRSVRIHLHELRGLQVVVVVDEHQLHGALISLLAEVLDEVLHLDLRCSAGLERRDACNLGDPPRPARRAQLLTMEHRMAAVAARLLEAAAEAAVHGPGFHRGPVQLVSVLGRCTLLRRLGRRGVVVVPVPDMLADAVLLQQLSLPRLPLGHDLRKLLLQDLGPGPRLLPDAGPEHFSRRLVRFLQFAVLSLLRLRQRSQELDAIRAIPPRGVLAQLFVGRGHLVVKIVLPGRVL